jgi:Zn-dependent protease
MKPFTFQLGNIPVHIHVSFLVVSAMLGASGRVTLAGLVQWVVVVLAGVLLHELGHAFTGRAFGLLPEIDLQGMGGLTSWRGGRRNVGMWRSVAISLAGPFTGIAIGVATRLYARMHSEGLDPRFASFVSDVVWVNLGWGVLNLLPILPLDGGNVLLAVTQRVTDGRGERPARYVSIGFAIAVGVLALVTHNMFGALLVAYFAIFNYQALRATGGT